MAVDTDLARHVLPENFSRPCLPRLHESPAHGYDRRTYELTGAGEERLRDAAGELKMMHTIRDAFLSRCDLCPGLDAPRQRS